MKQEAIAQLLPDIFQRSLDGNSNLLSSYLDLMVWFHENIEWILANISTYLDPDLAPDEFVLFLAHWVNMADLWEGGLSLLEWDEGIMRLRNLILNAVMLAHWRGTGMGLRLFLETATGQTGYQIIDVIAKPFHIIVEYPRTAKQYLPLIQKIVEREKPAYVTYQLAEMSDPV